MYDVEIEIELPKEITVEIETAENPEVTVEAELNVDVEIDLSNVQIITHYDLIYEEI